MTTPPPGPPKPPRRTCRVPGCESDPYPANKDWGTYCRDHAKACEFVPAHEPWSCRVHHGIRTRLDVTVCSYIVPARLESEDDAALAAPAPDNAALSTACRVEAHAECDGTCGCRCHAPAPDDAARCRHDARWLERYTRWAVEMDRRNRQPAPAPHDAALMLLDAIEPFIEDTPEGDGWRAFAALRTALAAPAPEARSWREASRTLHERGDDEPYAMDDAPPNACPHGYFGGYLCPECADAAPDDAALNVWTVDRVFDALGNGEITPDAARDGIKSLLAAAHDHDPDRCNGCRTVHLEALGDDAAHLAWLREGDRLARAIEAALPCEDPEEDCDADGRDDHRWCDYCIARAVAGLRAAAIITTLADEPRGGFR